MQTVSLVSDLSFSRLSEDSGTSARTGLLNTGRGDIDTPTFMPIGTYGAVKTLSPRELKEAGADVILGNTYHLYIRPGMEIIRAANGLHKFMAWDRPILTDSGGFQVFSLAKLRKISDEGVTFTSTLDGSEHFLTPERSMEMQLELGSDIIMAFDECAGGGADNETVHKAVLRTAAWTERCHHFLKASDAFSSSCAHFFPIVQGGTDKALRKESAETVLPFARSGIAIGGLAVGEEKEAMFETIELMDSVLPSEKLRYLMGVGKPEDIIRAVSLGVDLFDCVLPTRNARNGQFFTRDGRLNILNSRFSNDMTPISESCDCYCCKTFTRSYLRHLFKLNEMLGLRFASLHNVTFYIDLMRQIRQKIGDGTFASWSKETITALVSSHD
ncbi:MAG: tRNA guanosine(34) transglycosylase Tgt [Candidatus Neomarinimicrobiota bacterium]|nr:tRNA guanosine(34) transglycosylase Tgt [Candidatus Neomarinimicrobiota bacterium]